MLQYLFAKLLLSLNDEELQASDLKYSKTLRDQRALLYWKIILRGMGLYDCRQCEQVRTQQITSSMISQAYWACINIYRVAMQEVPGLTAEDGDHIRAYFAALGRLELP